MDSSEMKYVVLKRHLEQESKILGLYGNVEKVHQACTINELNQIEVQLKKDYSNLIGYDYENDEILFKHKLKHLELVRMNNYIFEIFFNYRTEELDYPFRFYNLLMPEDVKKKGLLHYYFHPNSLSMEDLVKTYSKFELLFMTGFMYLFIKEDFVADLNCSKEGLASILFSLFEDANIDQRCIITMFGPVPIYNNVDCNLRNLTNIKDAAHHVGLDTNMKKSELYKHYCLLMMNESFFNDIDTYRSKEEQLEFVPENLKSNFYYGLGNGIEKYQPVLKTNVDSYLIQQHPSKNLARKTIFLLDKERELYQKQIDNLYNFIETYSVNPKPKPSKEWKIFLVKMFNCGTMLMDYETEMKGFNPVDYELRLNLEPNDPETTDRFRKNMDAILLDLDTYPEEYGDLPLVTIKDNQYHFYDDVEYQLKHFFIGLEKMLDLGLYYAVANFGYELFATANYYNYLCYGYTFTMNELEIDEVTLSDKINPLES